MKKYFLGLTAIVAVVLCFFGCVSYAKTTSPKTTAPGKAPAIVKAPDGFITFPDIVFPKIMYYGADLGQFPPEVREWIMYRGFQKEKMEKPYMVNPSLKVWWGEDNNSVLVEASYTVAEGYVDEGTIETWGQGTRYSGFSGIFDRYGKYAHYQTLRFVYEHKLYAEDLLKTDAAFAKIIELAKIMCDEIDYDWNNFDGYRGKRIAPGKTQKLAVCEGYTDEVMNRFISLDVVKSIEKWKGPNHTWNVLNLVDGRVLYFDLTWFDNDHIDEDLGVRIYNDDYDWANITFIEELFRFSNVGYSSGQFAHNLGAFDSRIDR